VIRGAESATVASTNVPCAVAHENHGRTRNATNLVRDAKHATRIM
jgi:hypothetical protein